jgi:hypothetical protein
MQPAFLTIEFANSYYTNQLALPWRLQNSGRYFAPITAKTLYLLFRNAKVEPCIEYEGFVAKGQCTLLDREGVLFVVRYIDCILTILYYDGLSNVLIAEVDGILCARPSTDTLTEFLTKGDKRRAGTRIWRRWERAKFDPAYAMCARLLFRDLENCTKEIAAR